MTEPALPAKRTRKAPAGTASPAVATAAKPPPATPPPAKPKTAAPRAAKTTAPKASAPKAAKPAAAKPRATKTTVTKAATPAAASVAPSADGLPHRASPAPKSERAPLELARRIVDLAEDKKAADIVLLDLTALTTLADYFVICSGGSERQLDAIADGIVGPLRDEKTKPIGREGTPASHWVLVDFGSVVVHIFTPPERDYYGLEKHWSEARTVLRVQ